jgi:hypothetical protein
MGERDFYTPVPKQLENNSSFLDYNKSPYIVTKQTAFFLDSFSESIFHDFAINYFSSATLDYLEATQQGFHGFFDKKRQLSKTHFKQIVSDANFYVSDINPQVEEYFKHALVVFSFMPEMNKQELLGHGYSKNGIMSAPKTTIEFLERIKELRTEIIKIINGQTNPKEDILNSDSFLRTYGFFKTGQELELRRPQTQNEADDKIRSLLIDIDFD